MDACVLRAGVSGCVAALLVGCGGNYAVYGASSAPTTISSVVVNGGLNISITLGATAANVITAAGFVAFLAAGNGVSLEPPPRMKEDRTINAQDCSQPITNFTANLMCR